MKTEMPLKEPLAQALETVRRFIAETTGREPSDQELADALKRYFVLSEIKAHILMVRNGESETGRDG